MKKPKLIILPLLALVLSGCSISNIISSETESSNSESSLNESSEDVSISETLQQVKILQLVKRALAKNMLMNLNVLEKHILLILLSLMRIVIIL